LNREEDLLINSCQNVGSVTLIVKGNNNTLIHGVVDLRDTRSAKCIILLAKLPYQLAIRWRGATARAVSKVKWQVRKTISAKSLNISNIKLSDASERNFDECNATELSNGCGHKIISTIKDCSTDAKLPQPIKKYPIFYLNPDGYYITLMKFSRGQTSADTTKQISKKKI
jgi:hypothetical protein